MTLRPTNLPTLSRPTLASRMRDDLAALLAALMLKGPKMRNIARAPATRQQHLAAIHMAQKALGLTADDASALKISVTGVASAGDMTAVQRQRYLAHLSGLQKGQQRTTAPVDDAQWYKARALWHELAALGQVHTNTDAALMAYVKRQTHLEHWRFLNGNQVNSVIEALKRWVARVPAQKGAVNG